MQKGLKRELTLLDMTMLGLGAIVGSGWLFASQKAGNMAGPAAILSWLVGGVAIIFIALVYAELGAMLPEAGGLVRYPQFSHGSFVGYIMAFACIVAYSTVISIEAEAVVQYMSSYAKGLYDVAAHQMTLSGWFTSVVLILIFFILNYFSVKLFAKVNTFITMLKFITPALTVIVLFTRFHPANLTAHGFAPFGMPGVLTAVSSGGVVFAYLGFRQAVDMAGEAKNPQRNVPLAVILSVLLGIGLYALLQTSFIGGLPQDQIAGGWGHISFRSPFADLAQLLGLYWLATILFADAILSPAGTGNIYTASTSRLVLAQARNGFWWKIFKRVDEKSGVPRPALWMTMIMAIVWTAPFPAWGKLVGVVSGAVVFTYMIGPVSVLSLRRLAPGLHRPLSLKCLPAIALLAFIVGTLLIYWNGWATDKDVVLINLLSLIFYAGFILFRDDLRENLGKNIKAGIWLVVYMFFLLAVSYAGSKQFGGHDLILYPYDMLVVVIGAVVFFIWGNTSAFLTDEIKEIIQQQKVSGKQMDN